MIDFKERDIKIDEKIFGFSFFIGFFGSFQFLISISTCFSNNLTNDDDMDDSKKPELNRYFRSIFQNNLEHSLIFFPNLWISL